MNCLPWDGPCGRLAASFNISATDIMVARASWSDHWSDLLFSDRVISTRDRRRREEPVLRQVQILQIYSSEADKTEEEKALLRTICSGLMWL